MAVYVIAILVVVLLLFAAYRSLGAAPLHAADSGVLLRSLHASLCASLNDLSTALAPVEGPGTAATTADSDTARDARRVSAAVQQSLDRLPPEAELHRDDAAARGLLAAAAEDMGWAWRMLHAGGASPGLTAAATALAAHAADCCDQAQRLLATVPAGEPLNGS